MSGFPTLADSVEKNSLTANRVGVKNTRMNPREFVEEYSIRSLVSCFSGGKDSLVMTHYLHSELADSDVDLHVVYADTGIMLPIATSFVQEISEKFGWNLTIVRGNFFVRRRKIKNQVYYLKKPRVWKYAPLLFWTEKDVLRYMKEHGLPMPPNYKLGLKETCMCGVYSNVKQMLILKAQFPGLFNKIVELEANFRKGGAAFWLRNKPVYAKDLLKQRTLEELA